MTSYTKWTRPRSRVIRALIVLWLAQLVAPAAMASVAVTEAPRTLIKLVILSRHGVRSPIPSEAELESWTASPWPVWNCAGATATKVCQSGELTRRGAALAEQMGAYYRAYLTGLLSPDQCPGKNEVFVWADNTQRTENTGLALLRGFRPKCTTPLYFHEVAGKSPDHLFHPVIATGRCKLDAARAEREILARAGGSLSHVTTKLEAELATLQSVLRCCQTRLCQATRNACRLPQSASKVCKLGARLPSCVVPHPQAGPTEVLLGGTLRVASTFAELLLLEYANGFPTNDVGWGRITRDEMTPVFRVHTTAFDLEQRTPYIAKRQGSALVKRILLALEGKSDGIAPPDAKFVAYVGHDTNISNVAAMLGLSWQQTGYQKDQTPPAGALMFELHRSRTGLHYVSIFYVAQSLDDMRNLAGTVPQRTAVPIPGCSDGTRCPMGEFVKLAEQALDPDCSS